MDALNTYLAFPDLVFPDHDSRISKKLRIIIA
jgi:hypothetical protein